MKIKKQDDAQSDIVKVDIQVVSVCFLVPDGFKNGDYPSNGLYH